MTGIAKALLGIAAAALLASGLALLLDGEQLVRTVLGVVWWAPDNAARAWETYMRPHGLHGLVTGHMQAVHWLPWAHRLHALSEPLTRQKQMHVALLIIAGVLALIVLRILWRIAPSVWFLARGVGRLKAGTTQGSARWATPREGRRQLGPTWPLLRKIGVLHKEPPFVIGRAGRHTLTLSAKRQNLNVLAIGVPGEGKSSAIVIPNLLCEGERGRSRRSIVVSDPKGECHAAAGAVLAARGYRVQRLDFYDDSGQGAGYNPLAHVNTPSQALVFAKSWIVNSRGRGEVGASAEFWDSTATLCIAAAALHLNHVYRAKGHQAAPLAQLAGLFNEDWETLKETLLSSPCAEAQDAMRGFLSGLDMNQRLGGSVLVGLVVKFSVLNDPAVARVTARDSLDFRAMGDDTTDPLALFVVLTPGMEDVLRPLTGTLFMQLFDELVATANTRPGNALARRVFCYLDEVGTVGVIAGLPRRLATLRAAGVGMLLAVQDTIQLDELYLSEGRRTITSTAQCHIVFSGVGQEDAAWVSTRLGTATVVGRGASAGRNREELLVGQGGYNAVEVGRPLMTPEEIQQLPEGLMIVNALHARPIVARALPWYRVRSLRRIAAQARRQQARQPSAQPHSGATAAAPVK